MVTLLLMLLMFAEFISSCLMVSAIAWLRYLYDRYLYGPTTHEDWHSTGARYIMPPLSVITIGAFLLLLLMSPIQQGSRPRSSTSDVKSMLIFDVIGGVIVAALAVWLVVEARRYRGRHREVSYVQRLAARYDTRKRQTRGRRRQRAL